MSNDKKLAVVGPSTHYAKWIEGVEVIDDIGAADILLFTGGEDVSPVFYKESQHRFTGNNMSRDIFEVRTFNKAKKEGKKFIGVCRGSQFLTVMAGGKLFQHVTDHNTEDHEIVFKEGAIVPITSTHHQMMNPFVLHNSNYEIMAWTMGRRSSVYWLNATACVHDVECEPEVVYYNNIDALAIQGHPESMEASSPTIRILNTVLRQCQIT